jgi:NAD(P)-dependent dehydrogenase (short-subunit alcohol dehydrogenase family)
MTDFLRVKGRIAVVTGSSSGNGRAIALALAKEGASVVCSDLAPTVREGGYEKNIDPTHEVITSMGGKSVFHNEADVKGLINTTVKEFGRIDMCAPLISEFSFVHV